MALKKKLVTLREQTAHVKKRFTKLHDSVTMLRCWGYLGSVASQRLHQRINTKIQKELYKLGEQHGRKTKAKSRQDPDR